MRMSPGVIASTGGGLFHVYGKTPCWAKAAPPASVKAALANARPHKARQNAKRGKAKRAGTTILPPHLHRCLRSGPPRDCIKSVRRISTDFEMPQSLPPQQSWGGVAVSRRRRGHELLHRCS